jgi:3-methyladenine DNA glycosylase AlkD
MQTASALLAHLMTLENEGNRAGMARFGIATTKALGISMPILRGIARDVKADAKKHQANPRAFRHTLAQELWASRIHEAQILAILVEDSQEMEAEQTESWVRDVNSWDVCDQLCGNLLWKIDYAKERMKSWCADDAEFVRRVGIVLIAQLAVHDKKAIDARFEDFFSILEQYAYDERNFVKKAVNWSLRQLGKRSPVLLEQAIVCAKRIAAQGTPGARWIASDALREFAKLPADYFDT